MNSIKNIIRKWLDIKDPEPVNPVRVYTEVELRRMVGEAVVSALQGRPDCMTWFGVEAFGIKSLLENCIAEATEKPAIEAAEAKITERIGGEEFIDQVIERIRRKQLGGYHPHIAARRTDMLRP